MSRIHFSGCAVLARSLYRRLAGPTFLGVLPYDRIEPRESPDNDVLIFEKRRSTEPCVYVLRAYTPK